MSRPDSQIQTKSLDQSVIARVSCGDTTPFESERDHRSNPSSTSTVYHHIAAHQANEPWENKGIAAGLLIWFNIFNQAFDLKVEEFVLRIDALPLNKYSHFRRDYTGTGLRGEITMNRRHLQGVLPAHVVLAVLLHEILHSWQQSYGTPGKPSYHNAEYRAKAESVGLIVDEEGITTIIPDGPFVQLLRQNNFEVPTGAIPVPKAPAGNPKMKKYRCNCTTVRSAEKDLKALCLKCSLEFKPQQARGCSSS